MKVGIRRGRPQAESKIAGRLEPCVRTLGHALAHEAHQFRRKLGTRNRRVRRFVVQDRRHGFRGRVALERSPPGHHLVQHTAEGKQIAASVDRQAAHLFRRHVAHRAHRRSGVGLGRRVRTGLGLCTNRQRDPRQAEVEDLHPVIAGQKEVLRLQVSVDDALGVRGGEPIRDRRADLDGLAPGDRSLLQPIAKRFAFQQFHDRIGNGLVRAVVVDSEDVRMGKRGDGSGFALEAGQPFGVIGEQLREDLHGDLTPEARVAGAVHLPHAARAKRCDNLVRPKPAGGCEHEKLPHRRNRIILIHAAKDRAKAVPSRAR